MKSPITGKEMSIQKEERKLSFRKEEFSIICHFYLCKESGEQFTSTELDEINMQQLYNQYRDKHKLPFPDEIKKIREKYGMSAQKMSEILGFGVNSYRNYENGEVPSHSNGKLIQLVNDPRRFKDLVYISEALDKEAKEKVLRKVESIIQEEKNNRFAFKLEDYLLDNKLPDEFSGYRRPNLRKLTEMVVFFTEKLNPWKTQLNKLLFYADFLSFKRTCFSISGARYRAITMGPVVNNFNSIFEYIANKDHVDIFVYEFGGEEFKARPDRSFNADHFNDQELKIMDEVAVKFKELANKNVPTKEIIELSHKERAWIENEKERNIISYKYAFDLCQIE